MELYEAQKKLDLRHTLCPSTTVLTRKALSDVASGDIVSVRVKHGEHMESVPQDMLRDGHQVLDIVRDGSSYVLYIMKQ